MPLNKHEQAKIFISGEPFEFETPYMGKPEILNRLEVAYEDWGDPSNPAVLVCHALSGNTHAHDPEYPEDQKRAWWNPMVGPGKPIDTNRYYVICVNMLGGCGGTSGPASINHESGKPYGLHFPIVTIEDIVRTQKVLLDGLGVKKLFAVIGGSMGGFQALVWSVLYPQFVEKCIVIASSAYSNQFQIMTNRAQIDAIQMDTNYNNGCYETGREPLAGLTIAREIGFTTFISPLMMEKKFVKHHASQREPYADGDFHLQRFHEAENYLRRVSMYFGREFDANSMIYLLQTWNHFDMAVKFGSLAKAMQPVESEVLVIAATGDNLFPPYLSVDVIKALEANGKSCRYKLIDEDYGHDFFLLGDVITEKLSYPIKSFLGQV